MALLGFIEMPLCTGSGSYTEAGFFFDFPSRGPQGQVLLGVQEWVGLVRVGWIVYYYSIPFHFGFSFVMLGRIGIAGFVKVSIRCSIFRSQIPHIFKQKMHIPNRPGCAEIRSWRIVSYRIVSGVFVHSVYAHALHSAHTYHTPELGSDFPPSRPRTKLPVGLFCVLGCLLDFLLHLACLLNPTNPTHKND
jgi:hypothetical protein